MGKRVCLRESFLCPFWEQVYYHRVNEPDKMRIIARSTLKSFVESLKGSRDQKAVKAALDSWFHEAQAADWGSPSDVLQTYRNASIVGSDRVVFNIKGNDYRLVVAIDYGRRIVFIKWIGSHADYDKIDVKTCNMEIKPIRSKRDYEKTLRRIEQLWGSPKGTRDGDELDVLATLVEAYEREHYPIDLPDPLDAIQFRLEQSGKTVAALVGVIGHRTRVYEVMRGDRSLSLNMIRNLNAQLGIPADVLIQPAPVRQRKRRILSAEAGNRRRKLGK